MSRRRKGRDVNGVVLLDKPAGWSSNQAVQKVRWLFEAKKAGHTGSLDPFATGMLPICLGEASKTAGFMLDASKTYEATAWLGTATTTGDVEGDVCCDSDVPELDLDRVQAALTPFIGDIEQVPPMYSALKHEGERLYKLARSGREVERKPRPVHIFSLELLRMDPPMLQFRVHCSKGTYIRTLAEDIAQRLGTCAHLKALRRLDVGPFQESGMITLDELAGLAERGKADSCLQPVDSGLADWPVVTLATESADRFNHGNPVETRNQAPALVRVYGPGNRLLGLGEVTANNKLKPKRIMHLPTQ